MVSELRFDGRVAVITGAGAGLGRSHASLLASRGAAVVVNDIDAAAAHKAVDAIGEAGGTAAVHAADITEQAGAESLVATALDRFGRIDIVVNNAGTLRAADFGEMTSEIFDRMVAVNLASTFQVTRAAWPHLAAQQYGRVVSTTSNSGLLGTAGSTGYAAGKAGVWGLTRSLAIEGAPLGIHVNTIAPIAFTDMSRTSRVAPETWRSGEGDEWARRLSVAQVSPVVAWFAHDDCQLNGEVWTVAGGRVGRFVMSVTEGFDSDELTVEEVRDREGEVMASDELHEYRSAADEGRLLHRRLIRRNRT